eukprot:760593-Hanusia_phi.AAC.3
MIETSRASSFTKRIKEINYRASMRSSMTGFHCDLMHDVYIVLSKSIKTSSLKTVSDEKLGGAFQLELKGTEIAFTDEQRVPKLLLSPVTVAKDDVYRSKRPTSARINLSSPQYQRFIRPQTARARMQKHECGGAADG